MVHIGAYLTTCDEDAHWLPQWLAEIERLEIDFAVHFDRCSDATKRLVMQHKRCCGHTHQDDPAIEYTEHDKQQPFNMLVSHGYDWALHLDSDETLERDAWAKLRKVIADHADADCLGLRYLSLWGDVEHVRVDGPFGCGYHVKLYNLTGGRKWKFKEPTVNGAYIQGRKSGDYKEIKTDLVCLNHGAMTHELRVLHKQRWDRVYGAVGGNPYGFWDLCLDYEGHPPVIESNPYL